MKSPFRAQPTTGRKNLSAFLACFILVFAALFPSVNQAAPASLTARYRQAEGTGLTVEINIGSPPPSSLILVQRLPPGIRLLSASPAANNVNTEKGEVKWLLHSIPPGSLLVEMTLDRAVAADEISAEIRYKPPEGGEMITQPVAKP